MFEMSQRHKEIVADFRSWRKGLGFTQAQAGDILGISRRTVQDYEAGKYQVPRYIALACEAVQLAYKRKAEAIPEPRRYHFEKLGPGESFFVPRTFPAKVCGALGSFKRRKANEGKEYTTRTERQDGVPGVRVYRLK